VEYSKWRGSGLKRAKSNVDRTAANKGGGKMEKMGQWEIKGVQRLQTPYERGTSRTREGGGWVFG